MDADTKQFATLQPDARRVLQNSWLCVVAWAFNQAFAQCLPGDAESQAKLLRALIVDSIKDAAWFDGEFCERLRPHLDREFREAWASKSENDIVFPSINWLMAVNQSDPLV